MQVAVVTLALSVLLFIALGSCLVWGKHLLDPALSGKDARNLSDLLVLLNAR